MPAPPPPPPPPPPPGPPPPPTFAEANTTPPSLGKNEENDRNVLLASIRQGAKLKKTVTVDKSAPLISGKSSVVNKPGGSSSSNAVPNGGGPMMLGGLFANGMPKLRSTGQRPCAEKPLKPASNISNAKPLPPTPSPLTKPSISASPSNKVPVNSNSHSTNKPRSFPSDMPKTVAGNGRGAPPPPPPSNQKPNFNIGISNTTDSIPSDQSASRNRLGPPLPNKPPSVTRTASAAGAIGRGRGPLRAPSAKPPPPPKCPPHINGSYTLPSKGRPGSYTETETNSSTRTGGPPPPPRNMTAPENLNHLNRPAAPRPPSSISRPSPGAPPPRPPPNHSKPNFGSHPVRPPSARPPPPPVRAAGSAPPPPPPPPHRTNVNAHFPPPPSQTMNRNSVEQSSPPSPPPVRNSSIRSSVIKDFESKFQFQSIEKFPMPLPNFGPSVKSYPSLNDQNKRQRLPPPPPPQTGKA